MATKASRYNLFDINKCCWIQYFISLEAFACYIFVAFAFAQVASKNHFENSSQQVNNWGIKICRRKMICFFPTTHQLYQSNHVKGNNSIMQVLNVPISKNYCFNLKINSQNVYV